LAPSASQRARCARVAPFHADDQASASGTLARVVARRRRPTHLSALGHPEHGICRRASSRRIVYSDVRPKIGPDDAHTVSSTTALDSRSGRQGRSMTADAWTPSSTVGRLPSRAGSYQSATGTPPGPPPEGAAIRPTLPLPTRPASRSRSATGQTRCLRRRRRRRVSLPMRSPDRTCVGDKISASGIAALKKRPTLTRPRRSRPPPAHRLGNDGRWMRRHDAVLPDERLERIRSQFEPQYERSLASNPLAGPRIAGGLGACRSCVARVILWLEKWASWLRVARPD
jgi:hypothetical protein